MTTKDTAKILRKEINKLGLRTGRDVSVTSPTVSCVRITIKTQKALEKEAELKELVSKYEDVDRDKITGDILSGGNNFVFLNKEI